MDTPLASLALIAVVLVVHEAGHYYTGALAGIPAEDRRFVLLSLPPHVAIADGDGWASPFENDRFSAAYGRYDPTRQYSRLFTAGGFLAQVVLLVPIAVLVAAHSPHLGVALVGTSLGFVLVYLAIDVVIAIVRGRAFGDTTHLWRLHPPTAVATLGVVLVSHLGMLAIFR